MRVDPTFDALSGQAEFVKLLDSVGLPPLRTS
jgi:hypothetical protein